MSGSSGVGSGRWGLAGGRVAGLVVVLAVWLSVVGGGAAWATTGHTFAGQFGELGPGDGQFGSLVKNGPAGVAVMPLTGEVFTADDGVGQSGSASRVQRFDAAGGFQSAFAIDAAYEGGVSAIAVDGSGFGAVYVATGLNGGVPAVVKYTLDGVKTYALDVGSSETAISPAPQVAVDPVDGTVYVTAIGPTGWGIDSFDSTGAFISFLDGSGTPEGFFSCPPAGLAVDGSHRLYVLQADRDERDAGSNACRIIMSSRVDRFSAGVLEGPVDVPTPSAVAVDPASGEVYVAHAGLVGLQVAHLNAGGTAPVYTFDATTVAGVRAMAVSGAGTVYTSDATDPVVERFSRFEGPTVVTGGTSSVEARGAVLEGTIDPNGVASSYHFEYGTDLTYGKRTPALVDIDAGSGNGAVSAAAPVDGLLPNTEYHYRLVGSNAAGSIAGADSTVPTLGAPVDFGSPTFASAITPRSVRLHGTVNPNKAGSPGVSYRFEYGTTTDYGNSVFGLLCSGFLPPCGGEYQAVDYPGDGSSLSGLEPGTTYHFRLVVNNGNDGEQFGADQTFVTAPAAGGGATGVTTRRATLTGTVNPHGVGTTYHFNYGPTVSYGARTPEADGGSANGEQLVTQGVSGLSPDTTYHVQVVATSVDGVVHTGGDGLFRTAPAPTAEATVLTGASTDSMTLGGSVNTFGKTGYHFDVWSLNSSYTSSTPERPAAGSASAERVSAALTGLPRRDAGCAAHRGQQRFDRRQRHGDVRNGSCAEDLPCSACRRCHKQLWVWVSAAGCLPRQSEAGGRDHDHRSGSWRGRHRCARRRDAEAERLVGDRV